MRHPRDEGDSECWLELNPSRHWRGEEEFATMDTEFSAYIQTAQTG